MARKVLKLSDDFTDHAVLIAISSHENDYRLTWALNGKLGTRLSRTENLIFIHPKIKEEVSFSRYEYVDEVKCKRFQLIANRTDNAYLFEELKTFDYILLITGEGNNENSLEIIEYLRQTDIIAVSMQVEIKKLKNRKVLDLG